jgi:hypothetical protein
MEPGLIHYLIAKPVLMVAQPVLVEIKTNVSLAIQANSFSTVSVITLVNALMDITKILTTILVQDVTLNAKLVMENLIMTVFLADFLGTWKELNVLLDAPWENFGIQN